MAFISSAIYANVNDWYAYMIRGSGKIPVAREFIVVRAARPGAGSSIQLTNGPYILFLYFLTPQQDDVTSTLSVDVEGVEVYSASLLYQRIPTTTPNDNFLVGIAFTEHKSPVTPILAAKNLSLRVSNNAFVNYEIIRYTLEDAA